jgi:hypothetical protein
MKTLLKSLLVTLVWIAPALAAAETDPEGGGLLIIAFLGFGALIVVFQFIPSLILFGSMLKGLFTSSAKQAALSNPEKSDGK